MRLLQGTLLAVIALIIFELIAAGTGVLTRSASEPIDLATSGLAAASAKAWEAVQDLRFVASKEPDLETTVKEDTDSECPVDGATPAPTPPSPQAAAPTLGFVPDDGEFVVELAVDPGIRDEDLVAWLAATSSGIASLYGWAKSDGFEVRRIQLPGSDGLPSSSSADADAVSRFQRENQTRMWVRFPRAGFESLIPEATSFLILVMGPEPSRQLRVSQAEGARLRVLLEPGDRIPALRVVTDEASEL